MKLDRFINRPVLSTVISVLIVILGIIGLATLPVTQYPDIAPPTVQVRATYTGANSTAVLNSVIAPLEDQINGVENMMYIQSSASNNGAADINVYFNQGTDPDMAAVNVQNRVSMAQGLLPAEVTKVGVTTQKRQNSMLMVFSLYDETDSYNIEFIENYANINLIPEIKRVKGVGDANVLGQDYSMRIWLKPDVMAQYKLVPTDVSAALAEQNIEAAPGQFGERGNQTFQYTIRYKGRLQQTTEFEDIVIKALPDGNVLRLGDVADIELGRLAYTFNNMVNGHKAVSKLVSARFTKKRYKSAAKVLRCSLMVAVCTGGIAALLVFFGASFIENVIYGGGLPGLAIPLRILAPTIFLVAILGVIRGFFQGQSTMIPTAVSQILEQIVNAIVSIAAGYGMMKAFASSPDVAAYGAAGSTLGTAMGALTAVLFMGFLYAVYTPTFNRLKRKDRHTENQSTGQICKIIIYTMIPIILGQTFYQISALIDDVMFSNIMVGRDITKSISMDLGNFSSSYSLLIGIPQGVASAMSAPSSPAG